MNPIYNIQKRFFKLFVSKELFEIIFTNSSLGYLYPKNPLEIIFRKGSLCFFWSREPTELVRNRVVIRYA